jgi:hypothetical protein
MTRGYSRFKINNLATKAKWHKRKITCWKMWSINTCFRLYVHYITAEYNDACRQEVVKQYPSQIGQEICYDANMALRVFCYSVQAVAETFNFFLTMHYKPCSTTGWHGGKKHDFSMTNFPGLTAVTSNILPPMLAHVIIYISSNVPFPPPSSCCHIKAVYQLRRFCLL